jgi:hypothetical protein
VFKKANNISGLPDGCGRDEVRDFLRYVCKEASVRGENWKYKFEEIKFNNRFGPKQLKKKMTVNGRYVIFGASRSTGPTHSSRLKQIKKAQGDKLKAKVWEKQNMLLPNHAISVTVCDRVSNMYDNGCRGVKSFSVSNVAERLYCISHCFVFDLIDENVVV